MDDLFGSLQTRAGYTPDEIREMVLPDVYRLFRYWKQNPPLRDIVAAFVGVRAPPETPALDNSAVWEEPPEFE